MQIATGDGTQLKVTGEFEIGRVNMNGRLKKMDTDYVAAEVQCFTLLVDKLMSYSQNVNLKLRQ